MIKVLADFPVRESVLEMYSDLSIICLKLICSVMYLPLLSKNACNVKYMLSEKNELQKMQMKHITEICTN